MFLTLSLVLAALCLVPAFAKLRGHPKVVMAARHFGIPWERYQLIGVAELAAAGGLLAGLAWIRVGVVAAMGMLVLLVGALVVHRRAGDDVKHAVPALVALAVAVAYLVVAIGR